MGKRHASQYANFGSLLDFPEYWGDDLMDVNQVEVDKALRLLKPSFGL